MSLKDIRSECSDVASLLQPHVDGELADDERERVAQHLEDCDPCRAAVSEQLWVRATLRALEPEQAPQALRARVLQGLDDVDREEEAQRQASRPSVWSRVGSRARDLLRGGLIMVPAATVAATLFFVARGGLEEAAVMPGGGIGAALTGNEIAVAPSEGPPNVMRAVADIEPKVGFPIQVVPTSGSPQVQLVGARLDDSAGSAAAPAARLRYRVFREGRATGHHVIDRQRPIGDRGAAGTPVTFRGRKYVVETHTDGEPVVHFERGGVAHMIRLEGREPSAKPAEGETDFSHLLDLAHQLAQSGH